MNESLHVPLVAEDLEYEYRTLLTAVASYFGSSTEAMGLESELRSSVADAVDRIAINAGGGCRYGDEYAQIAIVALVLMRTERARNDISDNVADTLQEQRDSQD